MVRATGDIFYEKTGFRFPLTNMDHLKKACVTEWVMRLKACAKNEGGRFEYAP